MDTGKLVYKCGIFCRHPVVAFVLGSLLSSTLTYPLEHALWEHVEPFSTINEYIKDAFHAHSK